MTNITECNDYDDETQSDSEVVPTAVSPARLPVHLPWLVTAATNQSVTAAPICNGCIQLMINETIGRSDSNCNSNSNSNCTFNG